MIPREAESEILRLYHAEHWSIGTIARQLRRHHGTVRRVLTQAGVPIAQSCTRPSMADPFVPFILETLAQFPTLRASRLYRMVRERGYPGGPDHFRAIVARYRPRPPAEAYLRVRTLPAEQSQVDWAHFGHLVIGRARRPLMAFVMVLSYSRHLFLRFYLSAAMSNFLRGHVEAFTFFGGVPRSCLYDNLKSAVLERVGEAIHFNPTLLELSAWYHFQPRPVAVRRGNEKGRVERAIRFVRDRFFAARRYSSLEELNTQAIDWCLHESAERPCPEDRDRSVWECFQEEKSRLLPLAQDPFPTQERVDVLVHKTPYVRFDWNDYSIPHTHVRRPLVVLATLEKVRIADGAEIIADHPRSFDRGAQIEDPRHIQGLLDHKRAGRAHRAMDRLHYAAPSAKEFYLRAAERGANLGALTRGLLELLNTHGAAALEAALAAALQENAAHLAAVRHFIDHQRAQRGQTPPIPIELPLDPRVRTLTVRPHSLTDYEHLTQENCDEHPVPAQERPPGDPADVAHTAADEQHLDNRQRTPEQSGADDEPRG
jgi:transposase